MNDLELRISILYSSINSHFEKSKKNEPIITERILEDGKKSISIIYSGGEIIEKERLEAINRFNLIIHNIANLKDNLKNYFRLNNIDKQMVEDNINNSIHLSIITDLVNQEKHGYPLTRDSRSELNPQLINYRNTLAVKAPIDNIHYNPLDGKIQISADVVDSNNNFLFSVEELIEKAIESWESFFIQNIPNVSEEVIERKNQEEIKKQKISKMQHTVNEAIKIFENSEWIPFPKNELQLGMIVRFSSNDEFSDFQRGIINNILIDENSVLYAGLYTDYEFEELNYIIDQFNWQHIKVKNPNDLAVLTYYYNSYPDMMKFIQDIN